jgi:hypothetical protein
VARMNTRVTHRHSSGILWPHSLDGTHKALRGAPKEFAAFRAASGVRTPHELVHHMSSSQLHLEAGSPDRPKGEAWLAFEEEVSRFHAALLNWSIN